MARHNILTTAALALAGTLCFQTGAQAQNFSDFFRDYLGIGPSEYRVNVHEQTTISNLNLQRSQLESRISAALNAGQITRAEAFNLRAQISATTNLQSNLMLDGHLSFAEAQQLVTALNNVENSLQTAFTTYTAAYPGGSGFGSGDGCSNESGFGSNHGWGNGSGFGFGRNMRHLGDVNAMQARLQSRLEMGRASGRLTSSEYFSLKTELDRIASREARMRQRGGFINQWEHERLMASLRSLQFRLQAELRDSQFAGRGRFWY